MDTDTLKKVYLETNNVSLAAKTAGGTQPKARRFLMTEGYLPIKIPDKTITDICAAYDQGTCISGLSSTYRKQAYEISAVLKRNAHRLQRRLGERTYLNERQIPAICEDYHARMPLDMILAKYRLSDNTFRRALKLGGASKNTRKQAFWCKHCNRTKPEVAFWSARKCTCKECDPSDPCVESESARNLRYIKKFGITSGQYAELEAAQGSACAICGIAQGTHKRQLAVDHCHASGAVRGLLCVNCNTFLGFIEKTGIDPHKAIAYLDNPPAAHVLPPTDSEGNPTLF